MSNSSVAQSKIFIKETDSDAWPPVEAIISLWVKDLKKEKPVLPPMLNQGHLLDGIKNVLNAGNRMRSDRRAPGSFSYGAFFDARFR
jgi:hypothetical protein